MTLKNSRPYCDYCHRELIALTEAQALDDIRPHGWDNYRTASMHVCFDCSDGQFDKWANEAGFPACHECETYPCKRGRECWDHRSPQNNEPYETYYADALAKTILMSLPSELEPDDYDQEEPIPEDVLVHQRLIKASLHPDQRKLFNEERKNQ